MKKFLAFDIGGTNTRLALINESLKIEKELVTPTPLDDKEKFMANCLEMVRQFPLDDVVAIGAGVPGVVDREKGVILDLSNVHIQNLNFGEYLTNEFNLPVYIRNDAEVACLGEAYFGSGKRKNRVFFITISTGVGGALCVDKKCQDYVTEIGHTFFPYRGGLAKYEILAGRNIKRLAKMYGLNLENAKDIFAEIRKGTKEALELKKEWLHILDNFIKMIKNSYNPDIICMTGGFFKDKDLFFNELCKLNKDVKIVECKLKTYAGLYGAAAYAMQQEKII